MAKRDAPAPSPGVLSVGLSDGLSYKAGDYNRGDLHKIDRQIRHMSAVLAHCEQKALEILRGVGDTFQIVLSNRSADQRPRLYIVPKNAAGIREEPR
jgi:hypothetical protein